MKMVRMEYLDATRSCSALELCHSKLAQRMQSLMQYVSLLWKSSSTTTPLV